MSRMLIKGGGAGPRKQGKPEEGTKDAESGDVPADSFRFRNLSTPDQGEKCSIEMPVGAAFTEAGQVSAQAAGALVR